MPPSHGGSRRFNPYNAHPVKPRRPLRGVQQGNNGLGEATPPAGSFAFLATGDYFACGVKTSGTLACWGGSGQTAPAVAFVSVSLGQDFACGVKTDGTIACWGDNGLGQTSPPAP